MAILTTNVPVNNTAPVSLAAANQTRRQVVIYNPGTIALDVFLGASAVAAFRLFQFGYAIITPSQGDTTAEVLGQLVSAGPQNIAVTTS